MFKLKNVLVFVKVVTATVALVLPEIVSPALTLGPSGCDPVLYRGSVGSGLLWPHSFFVLRGRLLLFLHTPPAPLALLSQWTILCSRRSLES